MKIFNQLDTWPTKVNFVDENNVMLGYDTELRCCEDAGWFIADEPTEKILERKETPELAGWNFDRTYFKKFELDHDSTYFKILVFRIINGTEEMFIHLYNSHNGMYWHGFDFKVNDVVVVTGGI